MTARISRTWTIAVLRGPARPSANPSASSVDSCLAAWPRERVRTSRALIRPWADGGSSGGWSGVLRSMIGGQYCRAGGAAASGDGAPPTRRPPGSASPVGGPLCWPVCSGLPPEFPAALGWSLPPNLRSRSFRHVAAHRSQPQGGPSRRTLHRSRLSPRPEKARRRSALPSGGAPTDEEVSARRMADEALAPAVLPWPCANDLHPRAPSGVGIRPGHWCCGTPPRPTARGRCKRGGRGAVAQPSFEREARQPR